MKVKLKNNGSVLLITIFAVALLSAITIGILQMNTEEIQLMRNQIRAAEALAIAEAGLNDAFAELRAYDEWGAGFDDKPFAGGSYTVTITNSDATPPDETDGSINIEALGAVYRGATPTFRASHSELTSPEFDARADIVIDAGSYYYHGGMSGGTFAIPIPLDADKVVIQINIEADDYPQLTDDIFGKATWFLGGGGGGFSGNLTVVSIGTSSQGFVAKVEADITVGSGSPYVIAINNLRINE